MKKADTIPESSFSLIWKALTFLCQGHLFYWDKIERANYFLHNIVVTARRGEEVWYNCNFFLWNSLETFSCLRAVGSIQLSADKSMIISVRPLLATVVLIYADRWLAGQCLTFCQTPSTMAASGTWPSTWSPSTACCPRSASLRLSPVNQGSLIVLHIWSWLFCLIRGDIKIWYFFPNSSRLNNILKSKLREYARSLRLSIDKGNSDNELRVQIAGMMAEVYRWVII